MASDSRTHTPTPWRQTPEYLTLIEQTDEAGRWGPTVADCGMTDEGQQNAAHIVLCVNSHDGLVEALRSITDAAGNYCQAIDDIGTSGEPPEDHVERLDALEECIRDALVVSRRALEAAGIKTTEG